MKKVFIILKKEFLSRVKKRSFFISTLLIPIIIPASIFLIGYLGSKENESEKLKTILVFDESKKFQTPNLTNYTFEKTLGDIEGAKELFSESDYFVLLHIPQEGAESKNGIVIFSKSGLSLSESSHIKTLIESQIREENLKSQNLDSAVLASLHPKVKINEKTLTDKGDEKLSSSVITFGVGYFLGMLIYMFVFIYGSQVMQSVIEEKTNKVVEILVSIVKPMQLMMGKVFGIASVGLFQFLIWVVLISAISSMGLSYFLPEISGGQDIIDANIHEISNVEFDTNWISIIIGIPFVKIISLFLFYFLFGFLLYGAMFAAIGSAVETPQEAQQFVLPITLPMLISIIGAMGFVLNNPSGSVSFWLSIIPFTSPISMMTRVAFDVPWWEIALSMFLLVITTLAVMWVAGRIFKVGILTQGAKVSYKTLFKWFLKG